MLRHAVVLPEAMRQPGATEPAKTDFLQAITVIEQEISGKTWLCNDDFSVAGIFLFHISRRAMMQGFVLSEDLVRYTDAPEKRPALQRARQREQQAAENAR